MSGSIGSGYLRQVEANVVGVISVPNAIFLRLTRAFAAEDERSYMFAEMTTGQALRLAADLQDSVREALALTD